MPETVAGLIALPSRHGPKETMDRLAAAVTNRGMTVFARIDHAAGAMSAGLQLQPTELLIFGNAKAGTPLMQAMPTLGVDLPLRALVWQESGQTWLGYNDPAWLVARHGASKESEALLHAMKMAMKAVAKEAVG
jgi:uncharacterized protein (DUF302 family)